MLLRRSAGYSRPDLLEPLGMILRGNETENFRWNVGSTIATRFAFHEDEFDIVLDDGVGFVRFAQKAPAVFDLIRSVRDFVPDNGREVVESQLSATLLNRRMKRDYGMTATIFAAGEANIADHAD